MLVTVDVGGSVAITITKLVSWPAGHAGKEETGRHLHASFPSPPPPSTRSGRSRSRRMTRWRITLQLPFHAVATKKEPVA